MNFARNSQCFKCQAPKPEGAGGGGGGGYGEAPGGGGYGMAGGGGYGMAGGGGGFGGLSMDAVDWNAHTLTPFVKNFYTESQTVANATPAEVNGFRQRMHITVSGGPAPNPIPTFDDLPSSGACDSIRNKMVEEGYVAPTAIQAQGWPCALSGRDLVGVASTGSGKTLAFLLPAAVHIAAQEPVVAGQGPVVLIVAPTRELALQIGDMADTFCLKAANMSYTCIYGGCAVGRKREQEDDLRKGVDIVIATPGRLIDVLQRGFTNLHRVTYFVLDEADKMLSDGFEDQVRTIFDQVRRDRQVLLFTATYEGRVENLARAYLAEDYCRIDVAATADAGRGHRVNPKVDVKWVPCGRGETKEDKLIALMHMLKERSGMAGTRFPKTLVFANRKAIIDDLVATLRRSNVPALGTHGEKEQGEREWIMMSFRTGSAKGEGADILVATDVLQRGIDVPNVQYVINLDLPKDEEDFVHRVGRTGRAGARGTAYSLYTDREEFKVLEMCHNLNLPRPDEGSIERVMPGGRGGTRFAPDGPLVRLGAPPQTRTGTPQWKGRSSQTTGRWSRSAGWS